MDTKALAKSKRAHSQHHTKKSHPNQTSKAPAVAGTSAGTAKKPPGKQARERIRQSALPSNRDRYEEEFDSGSEDPTLVSKNRFSDVTVPKSKGADYGHLISQAQAQLQSQCIPNSEIFPSFDDVLPDFNQGVSSMLSVRGKGILSWTGDHNFIVEDVASASYEASFLSMDLRALAEQLAKIDLSQRLFIEADLLPPELCADGSKERNNQESDQVETTHESSAAKQNLDELDLLGHADGETTFDPENKITSSSPFDNEHPVPMIPSQGARQADQVNDGSRQLEQTNSSIVESIPQLNVISVVDSKRTGFEAAAAAAEAELDMLLDSFGETKFLDSSGSTQKPSNNYPVSQQDSSTSFIGKLTSTSLGPQPSNQGSPNLDDAIDDLLQETSDTRNQPNAARPVEKAAHLQLPSYSSPSSKVLDDFDSWLDTI